MKKKLLVLLVAVVLVASLCFGLVACNKNTDDINEVEFAPYDVDEPDYSGVDFSKVKIGMICLHDENSTYDKNFIDGMKEAQAALGLSDEQVIIVTGIPEGDECYQKACELAESGCNFIFADSFGHEDHMIKAAKAYPNVKFSHATGTKAHTEDLANYSNAFASIYEGRYIAGVAAGLKLNEMIESGKITAAQAKMGYVGAWTYAEVISGYTSFYLGAKSVCPSVTMDVQFTGSWYDETAENNAAKALIARNCVLISQHADSMGAPNACEEAGVPNVSYNGSTLKACPDTFIISSRINWAPYFKYAIAQTVKGEAIAKDWTGTIKTGSVVLTNLGGNAMAAGTVEKLTEVRNGLVAGTIKVFDTAKDNFITISGAKVDSYMADVDTDADFKKDTEVVSNGYFHESEFRSAPYFDAQIDGITLLNTKY
ncbi:MAG: BMP family ABC transporter substrate-binding protein [Clostridia bacterium]|nr:BMP family ABC transporter substrate-binding protein [Clostridia bacterium]